MKKLFSFAVVLFLLFAVGCSREDNGLHGRADAGEQIKFTATMGSTSAATKAPATSFRISDTRFSGTITPITASSYVEDIAWTQEDVITIAEAVKQLTSDYEVDPSGQLSLAAGDGLRWFDGEHRFVAVYPSVDQLKGALTSQVAFTNGDNVYQMDIPIAVDPMPTIQYCYKWDQDNGIRPYRGQDGATKNELYYGPNMRYARMTASSKVDAPQPQGVELVFYPQFSSVEVKLLKPDDMSGATVKLVGARLTAGSGAATDADLSGTPAISQPSASGTTMEVKSSAGRATVYYASNGSKHNYIDLKFKDSESSADTSSPELNESTPLSFTFLLLPVDVTQLELTLTLEVTKDGITKTDTKTLQLKNANGWIDLPAGKKLTVTNMETWSVDVLGPSAYTEKNFSVSASQKVKFSPGNLQAVIKTANSAANARWQFADRQFLYPARKTADSYSANEGDVVDLFMHPVSTTGAYAFGIPRRDSYLPAAFDFADWGEYLDIYPNSTSTTAYSANTYRTLTKEEWNYLLNTRTSGATVGNTIGTARYSLVRLYVGGTIGWLGNIRGMLIYPDDFNWNTTTMGTPPSDVNTPGTGDFSSKPHYTLAQFEAMEAAGVVFLPAAGYCGDLFTFVDSEGHYWSADVHSTYSTGAYNWNFCSDNVIDSEYFRYYGMSVRLVKDIDDFTVSAEGQKVKFSPGNLQAVIKTANSAKDAIWRFADEQYQYHATDGGTYSAHVDDIVDVFMHPESTTGDYAFGIPLSNTYAPTTLNFADWGKHLNIYPNSDPTSTPYPANTYRTLTGGEWYYLLNDRASGATVGGTSNARYSLINLNVGGTTGTILGMLIYPNGFTWTSDMGSVPTYVNSSTVTTAPYTLAQFRAMESAGVVFLPAAGYCNREGYFCVGSEGNYWSASVAYGSNYAHQLLFSSGNMGASSVNDNRRDGYSVRLVRNLD